MVPKEGSLALWGGIECTVNRVNHDYFDQLERSGHFSRTSDLDLIGSLGLAELRYPVLWEHSERDGRLDFTRSDACLQRLRELAQTPILGLLHHGSGPPHTSLLDPSFPRLFADYALRVAERYPWVTRFTPVNEPLTTARFSGLYGHWYPHGRDDASFVRALLGQCQATVLAMRAIRSVNADATLIQTEDMGHVRSTPELAYQANFENERRWLSFDLLCGRVDAEHPLHGYLLGAGASPAELDWFREQPCPPDVLGLNYYVTSERFLDHRVERYPAACIGGNAFQPYADVEAVRICHEGLLGPAALLSSAYARYARPLAITEAHLASGVEQRMAWFAYVFSAALEARRKGIDVRAVTAWALLGAYDWHCLVTRRENVYEAGAFSLASGEPVATEFVPFLHDLRNGQVPNLEGWWTSAQRLLYEPTRSSSRTNKQAAVAAARAAPHPPVSECGAATGFD